MERIRRRLTLREIAEKYKLYIAIRRVVAAHLYPAYLVISETRVSENDLEWPRVIEALPTFEGAVMFLRRIAEDIERITGAIEGAYGGSSDSTEVIERNALEAGVNHARASREKALVKR